MKRRDFLKAALVTGSLYGTGGLPLFGRVAYASGIPPLGNRVLVNIMLSGAPDFRHLFTPPFNPTPGSYGYEYWAARAGSHSIAQSASAYETRWNNDYFHVSDGITEFGILAKCGWLNRMWEAGNVAIISNAVGGTTRNHSHCKLVMNQGNLSSGPNDFNRSGWGGRLATYAGGNVISLSRIPTPFTFGPDETNPDRHSIRNLISARNMRELGLYDAEGVSPGWSKSRITRSLHGYYEALSKEMQVSSPYQQLVGHERTLREFGEPIDDRLASLPLPASIMALMDGVLSEKYLGEQIRNLYDSFSCSDILQQRVVSLELGGWDTHRIQRDVIEPKLEDLFGDVKALDVLYQELPANVLDNIVFVLGGEFGRQLRANGDNGTDHGRGTYILVFGNGVQGGIYGEMFPSEELARLGDDSPDITGLTTIDSIFSRVCNWVEYGTSALVFPDLSLSTVEGGVNLDSLFV